ncbi:MAG: ATP-binding cassette domain-containing protein [Desulfococcus multivorans]|jgi:ABC-2 type transport system ATP-binding protein|nr:ATP-binding cassette domain-containing protein [Desulfococcus multivorans]
MSAPDEILGPAMPADESPFVIFAENLQKSFAAGKKRVKALDKVTIRVRTGGVTCLIGPDGAGKTTFMRTAAGLLKVDGGQMTVCGIDAAKDPLAVQDRIGYMPQQFGLYEELSVQENLDLYADLQGVPPTARPGIYAELMQMTRLGNFTDRLAGRLSGGMKQKLGLACTLVKPPRLLLLDEPTVGVDPVSRRELWAIVTRLVSESGISVLLSTAYLDEAERCDAVVILHEGQVLDEGRPEDFARRLTGRTFRVQVPPTAKRRVQAALAGRKGIIDTVIQGDAVRVVIAENRGESVSPAREPFRTGTPAPDNLIRGIPDAAVEPVPPRFEDSYIARLKETGAGGQGFEIDIPASENRGNDTEPVIRVDRLQRRFGSFYAVRDVSFEVHSGEVFGLLGANGAGKTTTFRMLCGLLPASDGEMRVAGLDLRRATARTRARIGYMAQKFSLYRNLSVRQNLRFFSSVYNLRGRERNLRIQWALDRFDLSGMADVAGDALSLGYKQRLALACALMHEPEILFLDEPTSGVDPMARREFWSHINVLARSGVTLMVTTHFMEEAEYCDRLAIMAAGRILAVGTPTEIKARAALHLGAPSGTLEEAFIALIETEADNAE